MTNTTGQVKVYYRTNASIAREPIRFDVPSNGLNRDDYEHVATIPGSPELERVFELMNSIDGHQLVNVLPGTRSMMPGDVVVDEEGNVRFCAATGWTLASWT